MIPDSKKEEVRDAADIVEVVGDYVKLKRSGQAFTGLCPFHNERTPSFNVNPSLGIYKCFGCGEGGDVFSFVMKMDGVGFPEALRTLAERFGIELPEPDGAGGEHANRDSGRTESILHALRFAGLYYHTQLTESPEARSALDLLRDRGYAPSLIRRFGLGYAPAGGDRFAQAAAKEGFSEQALLDADLIKPSTRGEGFYDTFRGRLMFPLFNPSGRVIAFAGRVLDARKAAKYVNSSQTLVYNKSEVLYGIHYARNEMRRSGEAILVEGYTDVISLHAAGVAQAVASAGTALTPAQVRLLKRYASRLLMIYDADDAGQNAMMRGLLIALEEGLDVEMLQLPKGEDPDSFVKANGGEAAGDAFREFRRRHAADFITFTLRKAESEGALNSMSGVNQLMDELLEAVSLIPDPVHRQVAVSRLHTLTRPYRGGADRELFDDVSRRIAHRKRRRDLRRKEPASSAGGFGTGVGIAGGTGVGTASSTSASASAPGAQDPSQSGTLQGEMSQALPAAVGNPSWKPSGSHSGDHPQGGPSKPAGRSPGYERALLRLMVEHGESICRYVGHQINDSYFEHEPYRKLYMELMERVSAHQEIDPGVFAAMPDPYPSLIADVMMDPHTLGRSNRIGPAFNPPDPVQQAKAALKSLKIAYLLRMKTMLSSAISQAEADGRDRTADRRTTLHALTEVQRQLSFLEKTAAAACFPDPPGYKESQLRKSNSFDYTPRSQTGRTDRSNP